MKAITVLPHPLARARHRGTPKMAVLTQARFHTASVTKRSLSPPQTCPLSAVKPTAHERPNQESNCWIRQAARFCLMLKLGVEHSRSAAFYVHLIHQSKNRTSE